MNTTELNIKVYGDDVLRKKSKPVKQVQEEHRKLLSKMAQLMYDSSGVGLAAPQVGEHFSMIVVDAGTGLYKCVNPKIIKREGRQVTEEGCLSVPGVCIKVKRAKKVRIQAWDEFGKPLTIDAEDLLACVFQHEIDHLCGKLIVDYASLIEKIKIKPKLDSLVRKQSHARVPQSKRQSCEMQL
jgi:peptide deformylase